MVRVQSLCVVCQHLVGLPLLLSVQSLALRFVFKLADMEVHVTCALLSQHQSLARCNRVQACCLLLTIYQGVSRLHVVIVSKLAGHLCPPSLNDWSLARCNRVQGCHSL